MLLLMKNTLLALHMNSANNLHIANHVYDFVCILLTALLYIQLVILAILVC